jgi:hypothetical protein
MTAKTSAVPTAPSTRDPTLAPSMPQIMLTSSMTLSHMPTRTPRASSAVASVSPTTVYDANADDRHT